MIIANQPVTFWPRLRAALLVVVVSGTAQAAPAEQAPAPRSVALTLPDAVFLGLRNNRGIQSQYLQRVVDKFALEVAEDAFIPKVTLGSAINQQRSAGSTSRSLSLNPSATLYTATGASFSFGWNSAQSKTIGSPTGSTSNLSVGLVQPLLAGGGPDYATSQLRLARLSESNARLALRSTVSDTITQIILAYRSLIQADQQRRIAQASLKRARDLREVNQALIEAGRLARVELVQSDESIAQQQAAVTLAENSYNSARLALLTLLALDSTTQIQATDRLDAAPVKIELRRALDLAFAKQPAYLQQMIAIDSGRINLEVARNQRLWNVSLVAGAGEQATGHYLPDTIDSLPRHRTDYAVGLQFTIPLFDPAREQGEVNASISLRQAEIARQQLTAQIEQQVTEAVATIESQETGLQLARRARELSRDKLEIELTKLRVGRSSNFQVVSFQNDLENAENTELNATVAYLNSLTNLDQILGTVLETWRISLNDE